MIRQFGIDLVPKEVMTNKWCYIKLFLSTDSPVPNLVTKKNDPLVFIPASQKPTVKAPQSEINRSCDCPQRKKLTSGKPAMRAKTSIAGSPWRPAARAQEIRPAQIRLALSKSQNDPPDSSTDRDRRQFKKPFGVNQPLSLAAKRRWSHPDGCRDHLNRSSPPDRSPIFTWYSP